MKIAIIVGTRAELIKLFPLIRRIEESENKLVFIHTGQHNIEELCEKFSLPKPDRVLSEAPEESSKFKGKVFNAIKWNISLIRDIRESISQESPDYVLYHGDTMSTSLAALGSSKILFPIRKFETVHIESGLRSGSVLEPFPEEISRIFSDAVSDILFAVSPIAKDNLRWHEKLGKSVHNIGNTIVDSAKEAEEIGNNFEKSNYGLVTIHRHENIGSEKRMKKIVSILEESPLELIFPLHDNTRAALENYGLLEKIEENEKIQIMDLVDYPDFINMIKSADILYTDGGSIQEESLIYNVPCIVLRNRTERKEGIETGINYLSKFDVSKTSERAREMVNQTFDDFENPYGESGVSDKVIEKLKSNYIETK